MTKPVDAVAGRFADAGSIPAASTFKNAFPDIFGKAFFVCGYNVLEEFNFKSVGARKS